ncbi:hypothetical protein PUNSTDRAFT_95379 [Punctularia strigosozonata HHB-11173 SS5]|uniref:uncharacterized protein n=1 Tax=Punctularia strigosozonata (strain HHB-11173) TaxID=741275 RepID=UPI00044166FF|nr:uncharacterized protein PUNSTDRAFT_95379 [Punctularia strigosozonata HHB-11173 SS5]EIN13943.1 hypothetical protein PUNSTDRAFT_95379 [Punctularia strigosozonata HHB-11173 SS5]
MDKAARVHSNASNRAGTRAVSDRRVVYKGVLDNPFTVKWPSLAPNVQNTLLARLIALAEAVGNYHLERERQSKQKKRERRISQRRHDAAREAPKTQQAANDPQDSVCSLSLTPAGPAPHEGMSYPEEPAILKHLVVGVNEVTKRLEDLARQFQRTDVNLNSTRGDRTSTVAVVFICREDIDPPMLVSHFPSLVASVNSALARAASSQAHNVPYIKLVPFHKGAEASLAAAIGLRRAAALAIETHASQIHSFLDILEAIPPLVAPWLAKQFPGCVSDRLLEATHVKHLRTTAPIDMRAAKEARVKAKQVIKAKSREDFRPPKRRSDRGAQTRKRARLSNDSQLSESGLP